MINYAPEILVVVHTPVSPEETGVILSGLSSLYHVSRGVFRWFSLDIQYTKNVFADRVHIDTRSIGK